MTNLELLTNLKKKYRTRPHDYCSYSGFTFEDYFRPVGGFDLKRYVEDMLSSNTNKPTNYQTLVAEFNKISTHLNKINDDLISKHLSQIEQSLFYTGVDISESNMYYEEEKRERKEFSTAFIKAFNEYQETGEEIDFSKTKYSEFELYGVYYGVELSKYKLFLEAKKEEEIEEEVIQEPKTQKAEISMPQQILVLEYLGIIKLLESKVKHREHLYLLLHHITGKSMSNIKKELNKKLKDRVVPKANRAFLNQLAHDFDKMELNLELKQLKEHLK